MLDLAEIYRTAYFRQRHHKKMYIRQKLENSTFIILCITLRPLFVLKSTLI